MLLEVIINGLASGSIYSLVALGFVMIYKSSNIMNFAQGEMVMLGAYMGLTFHGTLRLSYWPAFGLALASMAACALIMERIVSRPLLNKPVMSSIIATLAIGIIFIEVVKLVWGPIFYSLSSPFGGQSLQIVGTVLTFRDLSIISVALLFMLVLYGFLVFTKTGTAIRATSQNRTISSLMGIRVKRILALTWAISGILAAVAGILVAPVISVSPGMGLIIIPAFTSAVLGGLESLPGAVAGGFTLGVLETAVGFYISTALKDLMAFLILVGVLMIRPEGLFATKRLKKV